MLLDGHYCSEQPSGVLGIDGIEEVALVRMEAASLGRQNNLSRMRARSSREAVSSKVGTCFRTGMD